MALRDLARQLERAEIASAGLVRNLQAIQPEIEKVTTMGGGEHGAAPTPWYSNNYRPGPFGSGSVSFFHGGAPISAGTGGGGGPGFQDTNPNRDRSHDVGAYGSGGGGAGVSQRPISGTLGLGEGLPGIYDPTAPGMAPGLGKVGGPVPTVDASGPIQTRLLADAATSLRQIAAQTRGDNGAGLRAKGLL